MLKSNVRVIVTVGNTKCLARRAVEPTTLSDSKTTLDGQAENVLPSGDAGTRLLKQKLVWTATSRGSVIHDFVALKLPLEELVSRSK